MAARIVKVIFVFLMCSPSWSNAQVNSGSIEGSVKSTSKEELAGAVVVIKGTQKGVTTDIDGSFTLPNIPVGTYALEIRFVGYKPEVKQVVVEQAETSHIEIYLEEDKQVLEAVEVAGKSVSSEINEQAFTVTALSAKEFDNSTTDVTQILGRVSGVRVLESGGLGSNMNFSLNGFSGDQVKFFLDGIPMDNFGSSLSLNTIPVNSIQRIEVYKGVVPVWLGTDALGGAVNIITNQQHDFLDASYSVGSFNTHRGSLNGAFTNKETGFTVRGTVNYNYSDNDYNVLVPLTDSEGNTLRTINTPRFHDAYESAMLRLEAGFVNKPYADQLLIGFIGSADENEMQNGATMSQPYGGIVSNSKSFVPTLKYSKENAWINGLDIKLNSSFNLTQTQNVDTLTGVNYNWLGEAIEVGGNGAENGNEPSNLTMDDVEFTTQLNVAYQIDKKQSLVLNYSFQSFLQERFDSERPDNPINANDNALRKNIVGLAYDVAYNDKWNTTLFGKVFFLGVQTSREVDFGEASRRIEKYKDGQHTYGYGLATSYFLLPSLQLKASFEHTYRLPWANEVFGDGQFTNANPELGPEQSYNTNVGASSKFRWNQKHELGLSGSFIYRASKDLIFRRVTVANPNTSYTNLAEIRTVGVEGNVDYNFGSLFKLGASITYQNITDQADQVYNDYAGYQTNYQKGYRLPNQPYLFGNAIIGLNFDNVLLQQSSLRINYFLNFSEEYFLSWGPLGDPDDKNVIPQQLYHNLELSYSLQEGKYNVAVECRNLTDELLYDRYFLQKPGRAFYVKLRYAIGK